MRIDANVVVGPWPSDASASWSVADVSRHLDRFGLSHAVVRSAEAVTYDAASGNASLLAAVASEPQLLPAFVLGPLDAGEHGPLPAAVRAVWLLPARHGWSLTGPEAGSLQDVLRRAGLPVFVDLEETDWSGIDALCAALPSVDVVVCGIGYRTLRQALPVLDRHPRLHVDLSYLAALDGLELLAARYGASRLLFGTGAPVRDDAAPSFLLERSALSADDRATVAGGTAARLLGLAEAPAAVPAAPATPAAVPAAPATPAAVHATLTQPARRVGALPAGRGPATTAEPLHATTHLPDGAADLPSGAAQLPSGAAQLPSGAAQLPSGAAQLPSGAAQLPSGAAELPDIVDAHAHLGRWPSSWLPHPDADTLLAAYDRIGTRHAVISHLSAIWGGDAPAGNAAALAAAAAHPDRLSVWLVANPNRPQDAEVLAEQLRSPLVRGFKVHPDTHDCPIDDARYDWVWRLAQNASVPVLAHGFAGTTHSDPLLFGHVAARHPELPLIVGHSGATVDGFRRTIDVGLRHPSILAETCGSWMTGRWLRRLVAALGAGRVLHGTDACLIDPRYGVGRVLGAGLDPADLALVLGGNARRVLGLPSPFLLGGH
ncbi:amidohydrolase family protein [Jiangella alba]|uniref:amidohydrolase family protein n=1 Tax=Jiangella alba TaxID=561176 RepID=UPI0015A218E5|nr:amidohydrolase family protein [Jiangella alba]